MWATPSPRLSSDHGILKGWCVSCSVCSHGTLGLPAIICRSRRSRASLVMMFSSVLLPMGAGKSLCYFVLPSSFDLLRGCVGSIVIVVCPWWRIRWLKQAVWCISCLHYPWRESNGQEQHCGWHRARSVFTGFHQPRDWVDVERNDEEWCVPKEFGWNDCEWGTLCREMVRKLSLIVSHTTDLYFLLHRREKFCIQFTNIHCIMDLFFDTTQYRFTVMALTATVTVSTYYQYYQYSDKINKIIFIPLMILRVTRVH